MDKELSQCVGREDYLHSYNKLTRLDLKKLAKEIASNSRKKNIGAKICSMHITMDELIYGNDGIAFDSLEEMFTCLTSRINPSNDNYDVNDTSMFNDGTKSVGERSRLARYFSTDRDKKVIYYIEIDYGYLKDQNKKLRHCIEAVKSGTIKLNKDNEIDSDVVDEANKFHRIYLNYLKKLDGPLFKQNTCNVLFFWEPDMKKVIPSQDEDIFNEFRLNFMDESVKFQINMEEIHNVNILSNCHNNERQIKIYQCDSKYFLETPDKIKKRGRPKKCKEANLTNLDDINDTYSESEFKRTYPKAKHLENTKILIKTYSSANKTAGRTEIQTILDMTDDKCLLSYANDGEVLYRTPTDLKDKNSDHNNNILSSVNIRHSGNGGKDEHRKFMKDYIMSPDKNKPTENPVIKYGFECHRLHSIQDLKKTYPGDFETEKKQNEREAAAAVAEPPAVVAPVETTPAEAPAEAPAEEAPVDVAPEEVPAEVDQHQQKNTNGGEQPPAVQGDDGVAEDPREMVGEPHIHQVIYPQISPLPPQGPIPRLTKISLASRVYEEIINSQYSDNDLKDRNIMRTIIETSVDIVHAQFDLTDN